MNKYLKKVGDFVENDEETIALPTESTNDKMYEVIVIDPKTNEVVWRKEWKEYLDGIKKF